MNRQLRADRLVRILQVIAGWDAPLTWERLAAEIEGRLGETWTRQSLARNDQIREAFALRKKVLRAELIDAIE